MKFKYYSKTDYLYIKLSIKEGKDSREVASGVVLDFDKEGDLVGIDIDHASKIADLNRLETDSLPISSLLLTKNS
jgi:uncharacterized protein YuzE